MLNIIVNPQALRGKGKRLLEKIERRLKDEQVSYQILRSGRKGAIGEFARCLTQKGQRRLVAFGGDGTLNEMVTGLVDPEECEIGLIPAGTGNDFAASAGIPSGMAALELILNGEAKPTDYIQFDDGKRSINIAGLGIDVDILQRCARKKIGGRRSKYFFSLLASLCRYRKLRLGVTVNGEYKEYDALIAALCNGKQFGGGIPFCPEAVIDDGMMDLMVVDCPKRGKIPAELLKLMRGKILNLPITHHILCEEACIAAVPRENVTAQYDGELMECERLHAKLVSGKLKMFRS